MGKISLKLSQTSFSGNKTKEYTDGAIVEGIINNSNAAIRYIYKSNYPKIQRMVWSFQNTVLQPEDIFHEGLTRAILNVRNGKFRGESSFSTYLNSICRNICFKELSKHHVDPHELEMQYEDDTENHELLSILVGLMNQLEEKCRIIIDLRFNISMHKENSNPEEHQKNTPFEIIAEQLGLSPDNARQRFKRCMDKLREMVMNNPEIKEYYQ